jgi:hypothetical protein
MVGCGLQAHHWRASGRFQSAPERLEIPDPRSGKRRREKMMFDFIRLIGKREKR